MSKWKRQKDRNWRLFWKSAFATGCSHDWYWLPYALQKGVVWLIASRRFFDEQNKVLPARTSICRMTLKTSSQRKEVHATQGKWSGSKTNKSNLPNRQMVIVLYTMKTEGKRSLYMHGKKKECDIIKTVAKNISLFSLSYIVLIPLTSTNIFMKERNISSFQLCHIMQCWWKQNREMFVL